MKYTYISQLIIVPFKLILSVEYYFNLLIGHVSIVHLPLTMYFSVQYLHPIIILKINMETFHILGILGSSMAL